MSEPAKIPLAFPVNTAIRILRNGGYMKAKVTTTLDADLWERFRIQAIREKVSAAAIFERLMAGYLGESSYPSRSRGHAQGKRAHAKTAKTAARQARKAV
jgi:hypothetical protein